MYAACSLEMKFMPPLKSSPKFFLFRGTGSWCPNFDVKAGPLIGMSSSERCADAFKYVGLISAGGVESRDDTLV